MDGLRLSLIVAGVVVVALVYFWTARRRRIEREAGSFDRFQAWSDDSRDPLVDDPEDPYRNLEDGVVGAPRVVSRSAEASADDDALTDPLREPTGDGRGNGMSDGTADGIDGEAAQDPSPGDDPVSAIDPRPHTAANARGGDSADDLLPDPQVLQGLEAIADSLRSEHEQEPVLGELGGIEAAPAAPAGGRPAASGKGAEARDGGSRRRKPARRRESKAQAELDLEPPPPEPAADPDMVVVLNVMARDGERLAGAQVHDALEKLGFKFGDMQAYHYYQAGHAGIDQPMFSALNAVNPGTLDPKDMDSLMTPGLALVMRLPGPGRALESFDTLHQVATRLAVELDARLCDSTRSSLTRQASNHLREQIAEYARRKRLGV